MKTISLPHAVFTCIFFISTRLFSDAFSPLNGGASYGLRDHYLSFSNENGQNSRQRSLQGTPAPRKPTRLWDISAEQAMERTKAQLEKMNRQQRSATVGSGTDREAELEELTREYLLQSANALKILLKERRLPRNGRKPDLARRLAENDIGEKYADPNVLEEDTIVAQVVKKLELQETPPSERLTSFACQALSPAAGMALAKANFTVPSPIQAAALPPLFQGESLVLHAATGSGKTLAYVLPISEALWTGTHDEDAFYVILTPTRELAAQVAGIASVLCPPGTVRLVARPTNLFRGVEIERGELPNGGIATDDNTVSPRLFVGSAKAIMTSLYGGKDLPASPTPKPLAMAFLKNVKCLVLDEVDRILNVKTSRGQDGGGKGRNRHEKPAATVTAAVVRLSLGRAQIVAASATVGRPLRRELARVMGLPPQDCPPIVRGSAEVVEEPTPQGHISRAVTIPDTVRHYVISSESSSTGKVLTTAYHVIQNLQKSGEARKMLLVLSKGFNMNTQNAIGALSHFDCQPKPESLLDCLESAATKGTDGIMQQHRIVSGATGVGETIVDSDESSSSSLLVTGEDTVRGLHLDGLDVVIVVGRPAGPDEYTHIAGRTGRAGKSGIVLNVVDPAQANAVTGWERMLSVDIEPLEVTQVAEL